MNDIAPSSAWRSESVLVLRPAAVLPDLCFRCGAQALGFRLRRRVSWHTPWLFLLAIHPLIYLLAALSSRKRGELLLPLCKRHRRRRRLGQLVGWTLVPLGVAASGVGLALDSVPVTLLGAYLALAAWTGAVLLARVFGVDRIDEHFVRLRGADLGVLDQLPDWDAYERTAS